MKISLRKSKKKIITVIVLILVIAALIAGGVAFYRYRQANNTVEVVPVENVNMYVGESSNQEISGYVTATKSQEVVLSSNQVVKEVLVKKGQKVEAGTDLIRLDTEEELIDLQLKGLSLQDIQQKISKLNKELTELQSAPVISNASNGTASFQKNSKTSSTTSTESSQKQYTAEEKQKLVDEKRIELNSLEIDFKEANLEYTKLQKQIQNATIKSTIKGTVKSIQDPSTYTSGKGKTFLKIVSSDGLYLQGSVSELKLNSIEVGDELVAKSWETGEEFTAKVTEVSPYPMEGNDMSDGMGNPNASYYPFKAYIEDTKAVNNGEYVTITLGNSNTVSAEDGVFLPPAYIRKDGNRSYVYLKGKDGLLEKRYIKTGKSSYGISVEILEGVTLQDYIAFPYGKNVKEDAKTKVSEDGGMDYVGEY